MDGERSANWLHRRLNPRPKIVSVEEMIGQVEETPEFWVNDIDEAYREGFEDGFDYALQRVEFLYRKRGFVRVREICNILFDWSSNVLEQWKVWGEGKHRNDESWHPIHEQDETWSDIRERIIRRDGKCCRCGDVVRLEVDHIVDVQNGGLPKDDNLRTLCKVCHKGKAIWDH